MALGKTEAALDALTGGTESKIQLDTTLVAAYSAGLISWDTVRKVALMDTGYTGVRNSVGMETYVPFFNDTGSDILDGSVVNATGIDATNKVVKGILADASSPATSSSVIGIATHNVTDQTVGLATIFGDVNDIDTSGLLEGGVVYLSETAGQMTNTRPKHPATILIIGTCVMSHATTGTMLVDITRFTRSQVVKDYELSTGTATAHYIAGFYDWSATDANLTQASPTITHGAADLTRAAHVGIVPQGAGSVDSGQVGIRAVGTLDSETGAQTPAQTRVITDDITTLAGNIMVETTDKFSGTVSIELYVVSGTPTVYSLDFNYGYSKYEDFANADFSLVTLEAVWEGNATDTGMNIELIHHRSPGWSYAATGFVAGNGFICQRSVDQATNYNVSSGIHGAYKRTELDEFIEGSGTEGVLLRVTTDTINSIASMDIHMLAYKEDLT